MPQIDSAGTYRVKVLESGLGLSKKNSYPQWIAKFEATEKWVETAEELAHFDMKEPGWVDWSEYDDTITGFFVLFNDPDTFDENTKLLNYDQIQLATGWDGTEFDSLNDSSFDGAECLIRVQENTYEGNTRLQVDWIDDKDASPTREVRKLDEAAVKGLAAKLKIKKKAKPTAAKPASKPAAKPAAESTAKTALPAKKSPPKTEPKPESEPEADETPAATMALPAETTKEDAWELVTNNKGGNSDSDIEEAWISSCGEVGEDKDEDNFTGEDWARVRDLIIKDLALDVTS